jgi:thiol:disulfide interchange protein
MTKKNGLVLLVMLCIRALPIYSQIYEPVKWSFSAVKISDCVYDLQFKASIDKGYHLYSQIPVPDGPIPTEFHITKTKDFELVGKTREPKPIEHVEPVFNNATLKYFELEAVFHQKIKVKSDKDFVVQGDIDGMACDDSKCINFSPPPKFEFKIKGSPSCLTQADGLNLPEKGATPGQACVCDTQKILTAFMNKQKPESSKHPDSLSHNPDKANPAQTKEVRAVLNPATSNDSGGGCNPLQSFIYGCLGGLLALITPCVYSMIPLTVSFFTKRSKTKAAGRKNAVLYGFFIIVIYVVSVMTLVAIFGPKVLEQMSSNVWVNLFFFAVFLVFAFSFLGAFEITLPSSWINKADSASDKGGVGGIFFMALTLVLVSFSCTGAFLGNLIPLISKGSLLCPLFGMIGFGLVLALPFALFAFFPSMLNTLPKSGGWLNAVKVSLGLIELALAMKFLSNADLVAEWHLVSRELFIAIWIAVFGVLAFYLFGKLKFSHDSDVPYLTVTRFMFGFLSLSFTLYLIPGLWGAPLNMIAGFPPPQTQDWSENMNAFGSSGTIAVETKTPDLGSKIHQPETSCPKGINNCFHNYYDAMAYAKAVKKPVLVDFTGWTCLNCRKTEQGVWPKPEVLTQINSDYVLVSLYVDERRKLETDSQYVSKYSKETIKTTGEKWHELEIYRFNTNTLPFYVLLDNDGKELNTPIPYTPDVAKYAEFLREGNKEYKRRMGK